MGSRYILCKLIFLLVLVLLAGCGDLSGNKGRQEFDLGRISAGIERPAAASVALDGGAEDSLAEENIKVVPVRDINTGIDGGNPYLAEIKKNQQAVEPGRTLPGEGVLLNFDNADIYEVIQVIAEILDISYIIDPQVKGVVNIRSGKKIPMSELEAVFRKLLNINGLDIRSEGEYNYIYMTKKPGSHLIFGPDTVGELKDSPRFIIQIIPVMHLAAAEAQKMLEPYTSEQGRIEIIDNSNTLFVADYESKVVDIMMIMARLDVSPLASLKVRLVRVERSPLFDLRDELNDILGALQVNSGGHDGVTVLALERSNSLLLVSNNQELLDSATRWITELDEVPTEGRDNIYIYNVRNSVASELAGLVTELVGAQTSAVLRSGSVAGKKAAGKTSSTDRSPDPSKLKTASPVKKTSATPASKSAGGSGLRWAGEPTLIPDDSRNIILLRALPSDYSRLVKLLERLDNMPRQVLIEVMVAEVSLTDSWELGVEWSLHKQGVLDGRAYNNYLTSNLNSIANSSDSGPINHLGLADTAAGLTYSILNSAGEAAGILNAIADNNELSILSSPQVMVLNNETATVNVGEQVPIVTSQTGDIGSSNLNQTIQYKDTGVILKVTPKINYDGIIILDINQQVSSAAINTLGGNQSPVISNRELNTKLAVRDGQTIFMGGLMSTNVEFVENGIPLLKDIPLLGWIFKYQKEVKKKKELLVMITPYVIETEDVLSQYVESFNAQMQEFRDKLRK
ncbi:MAG: type II secretion system secretin GspD [Desulfobulbaceae bacterium]|nr:type II secretion system secretin GspD [Desulfobulbaceae bacterium]